MGPLGRPSRRLKTFHAPHLVSSRALRAIVSPSVSLFFHAGLGFFLESLHGTGIFGAAWFFFSHTFIIHFLFIMRGRHIIFTERLSLITLSNYPTAKGANGEALSNVQPFVALNPPGSARCLSSAITSEATHISYLFWLTLEFRLKTLLIYNNS